MNENLISKIKNIFKFKKVVNILSYEELFTNLIINNPASSVEIENVNSYFKNRLPQDYLSFLLYTNGCTLFEYKDLGGFEFLNSANLISENEFIKNQFDENVWDENIIMFCSCIGDGDYIGFKILDNDRYVIIDCFRECSPSEWETIGNSLDDFIEKILDSNGEKFWL